MIGGRPAVFLSCSEKFRHIVADAFKDALANVGVHGVIVSEEPRDRAAEWDPEAKVESYLRSCEAFITLATPDDELADGSFGCRQNVSDEVGRARSDPRLRQHMIFVKAPNVRPWSNINPTYVHLDVSDPEPAIGEVIEQLRAWGILMTTANGHTAPPAPDVPARAKAEDAVSWLVQNLDLGDHEKAELRVYHLFMSLNAAEQLRIVSRLAEAISAAGDGQDVLILCSVLEAIDRVSPRLVPVEVVEHLASADNFSIRSSASTLLWQWAETDAARVPIALLGRLAQPNHEDWYVQAPALAAAKQLLLKRPEAEVIFRGLAASKDADDRYSAVVALLEIAKVEGRAVSVSLVGQLSRDIEETVREKAQELAALVHEFSEQDRWSYYHSFGL